MLNIPYFDFIDEPEASAAKVPEGRPVRIVPLSPFALGEGGAEGGPRHPPKLLEPGTGATFYIAMLDTL